MLFICCSRENLFDSFFRVATPLEFCFEKSMLKSPPITMVDLSLFSKFVMISVRWVEKLSMFPLGGLYILIMYIAFVHGLFIGYSAV